MLPQKDKVLFEWKLLNKNSLARIVLLLKDKKTNQCCQMGKDKINGWEVHFQDIKNFRSKNKSLKTQNNYLTASF